MKVQVKTTKTEYDVDIDQAWVWVRLEEELGLTVGEAQDKMSRGSTKAITYAIWIATDTEESFKDWVKTLLNFDYVGDDVDPKEIADEA